MSDTEGYIRFGGDCVCGPVYTYGGHCEPGGFAPDCPEHGEKLPPSASRAQAREEIGRMYTQAVYGEGDWSAEGLAAADALLANFEYLAALLGFVAADEVEHAWRRNDVIYPEDWVADGPPPGFELIRRTVGYGPWEKATNADAE